MFYYLLFLILETIQYSLLYSVIGIPLAYYNNKLFVPVKEEKHSLRYMVWRCILHIVVMSLFFMLLKFIVQSIPFIFAGVAKNYDPYSSEEYLGTAVGAYIIFFYLQINLTDRLTYIANKLFRGDVFWDKLLL